MRVLFLTQAFGAAGPASREWEALTRLLKGCECALFAAVVRHRPPMAVLSCEEALTFAGDPDALIICQYTGFWPPVDDLLSAARARCLLRLYTIPWIFAPEAHDQLQRLSAASPKAVWVPDSEWLIRRLNIGTPAACRAVALLGPSLFGSALLPDPHVAEYLSQPHQPYVLARAGFSHAENMAGLAEVIVQYRARHGRSATLALYDEGVWPDDHPAAEAFLSTLRDAGIEQDVEYVPAQTPSQLLSWFLGSDAYLCHEWQQYDVPAMEARRLWLPVIAAPDAAASADSLHRLVSDPAHRQALVEEARREYLDNLAPEQAESSVRSLLKDLAGWQA